MQHADDDSMFDGVDLPNPGNLRHQQELKIPLLRYRKSSRAGLWLLAIPLVFAITVLLRYHLQVDFPGFDYVARFFHYMSDNAILTFLIPVIFVGLPLLAMILNCLAICHFTSVKGSRELLVTIKYRPVNITIFLLSFAVLVYYLLPDNLP